jgi:Tfp pilus assembly protein PilV
MWPCLKRYSRGRHRTGSTLIEVLMAAVILTVVVLGTSAQLYFSRSDQLRQLTKRTVLEAASTRLERLRAAGFDALAAAIPQDYDSHYLVQAGGAWTAMDTDPGDELEANGRTFPMTTTVRFGDIDGGPASYDCLQLAVNVPLNTNGSENITLETWCAF